MTTDETLVFELAQRIRNMDKNELKSFLISRNLIPKDNLEDHTTSEIGANIDYRLKVIVDMNKDILAGQQRLINTSMDVINKSEVAFTKEELKELLRPFDFEEQVRRQAPAQCLVHTDDTEHLNILLEKLRGKLV